MPGFQLPPKDVTGAFAAMAWSHACLRVSSYEIGKRWFIEKLDFRLVFEWPGPADLRMAYLAAPNDDRCVVEIVGDGEEPSPTQATGELIESFGAGGYHHLCFTVPDIAATLDELVRRGVTVAAAPFEVSEIGRRIAFVNDPFGNLIEFEQVG